MNVPRWGDVDDLSEGEGGAPVSGDLLGASFSPRGA